MTTFDCLGWYLAVAAGIGCAVLEWQHAKALRRVRELEELAYVDGMTGVGNHRFFQDQFARVVAHALRAGEPASLMAVDMNGLKRINDTYGHGAGDQAICALAEALGESVRATDPVCRKGGDEFLVPLPACGREGLSATATRFVRELQGRCVHASGTKVPVTAAIGGATLRVREGMAYVGENPIGRVSDPGTIQGVMRALMERADAALYAAKQHTSRDRFPIELE